MHSALFFIFIVIIDSKVDNSGFLFTEKSEQITTTIYAKYPDFNLPQNSRKRFLRKNYDVNFTNYVPHPLIL